MPSNGSSVSPSPPRAPPIKYSAPLGTRWAKETAAAGGVDAFDLPTDPKNIGPWILGECVGKGASGRVKIAKHRLTGQLAAVKILPIAPLVTSRASVATQQAKSDKQRLGIDREITMMKLMNHPNIIRIYDVFESDKDLFLVLEYVEGGELFDFLVNRGRLPPAEALAYFKQIVYGLNYAHTFSIIHRDLKPENILIATISPPLIKIADWGMAAFAPPSLQLETSCGSPHYASPEIVNGQKYQGNATDIWSCGVILYALLTGRLPFDDKNVKVLLSKVKGGKYEMPAWIDPLAQDLLSRMLVVDVNERITVPEILEHPWFRTPCAEQQATELAISQLPPSPSTLARPIASPSLIDPELLSSLRVIWGRHTDPNGDSIKRDLCSPAGQGVHAKAFYFLLGKYREESLRNTYDLESESDANSLRVAFERESQLYRHNKNEGKGNSVLLIEPPPCYPLSTAPATTSTLVPPLMRRSGASSGSSSRERAPSPAGPRAPPSQVPGRNAMELWRTQSGNLQDKTSRFSVNSARNTTLTGVVRGGRPPPSRRGYTYSHPNKDISTIQFPKISTTKETRDPERPRSTPGIPRSPRLGLPRSSMFVPSPDPSAALVRTPRPDVLSTSSYPTPKLDAAAPILTSQPDQDIGIAVDLSRRLSIRDEAPFGSSEVEDPDDRVIEEETALLAKSFTMPPDHSTFAFGPSGSIPRDDGPPQARRDRLVSRAQEGEDKENKSLGDDNWSYVSAEDSRSRGVGLGVGLRDMGRNMGNIMALRDSGAGTVKGKKDKRSRPPTLDFRSINNQQKRMTVLGSPIALSSPVNAPSSSSRILTSPVVGEFKGWFSNLFSWKPSSNEGGVLYSAASISRTCSDIRRILEGLGVIVEGLNNGMGALDSPGILRCRVDDSNGSAWASSNHLKPVRFRLEFSAAPKSGDTTPFSSVIGGQSHQPSSFLTPPAQNHHHQAFLSAVSPPPGFGGSGNGGNRKARNSILLLSSRRSSGVSVTSSPCLDAATGGEFPTGCECMVMMVYEKGSVSSFRTVWRKVKEVYGIGGPTALASFVSPAMGATPMAEHPDRFVL